MKNKRTAKDAADRPPHEYKIYRFGFWLFFFLAIFSVVFSVWAISSIYANFTVVTKILDESFERTNFVLDITSSKMIGCEQKVRDCQSQLGQRPVG
jgi:hypothetical protein